MKNIVKYVRKEIQMKNYTYIGKINRDKLKNYIAFKELLETEMLLNMYDQYIYSYP